MNLLQALSHTYTRDLIPLNFYKEDVTFCKQFVGEDPPRSFKKLGKRFVGQNSNVISSFSFLMDGENQAQENLLMFRIHKKQCKESIYTTCLIKRHLTTSHVSHFVIGSKRNLFDSWKAS